MNANVLGVASKVRDGERRIAVEVLGLDEPLKEVPTHEDCLMDGHVQYRAKYLSSSDVCATGSPNRPTAGVGGGGVSRVRGVGTVGEDRSMEAASKRVSRFADGGGGGGVKVYRQGLMQTGDSGVVV